MVSMLPAHAEETEESHGTGLQAMTEDRRNELMKHRDHYNGSQC